MAQEIEETLDNLHGQGYRIRKLSIVGYSLGGLVARYAIGLLDARGWLGRLEPLNFTTFATPHVGVRLPARGVRSQLFNVLGARTISVSGRQLFLIDSFRGTGKPLLSILADPDSIFIQGLAKFKRRSVYANVINDRSAVFYTTYISALDPFKDLESLNINYVKGYKSVIIDPDTHTLPSEHTPPIPLLSRVRQRCAKILTKLPLWLFLAFGLPLFLTLYLTNSVIQTCRSRKRIRLHEEGNLFGGYRVPLVVQNMQHAVEDAFENVNARQDPEYVAESETPPSNGDKPSLESPRHTLALTPPQLAIIDSLNNKVGFCKFPVYIHNHRHSHAAIIVRMQKKGFDEGKVVIRHWLDELQV